MSFYILNVDINRDVHAFQNEKQKSHVEHTSYLVTSTPSSKKG